MTHLPRPKNSAPWSIACFALVALSALAAACDRAPGNEREWAPSDHDQPPGAAAASGQSRAQPGGATTLIDLAWSKNCASCHGAAGRGDGPQGPMLRAPDLTRADWQSRVTDQEILETIRKGRNKMPAFDLPQPVLEGLVQRIRTFRGKRRD
jgi:mono/diheme cytochrome c family protein